MNIYTFDPEPDKILPPFIPTKFIAPNTGTYLVTPKDGEPFLKKMARNEPISMIGIKSIYMVC